jgi:hypothetical protein
MKSIHLIIGFIIAINSNAQSIKLISDLKTGSGSSNPEYFFKATDNKVYFFAINPLTDNRALYVTDGKSTGTQLLLDDVYTTLSFSNVVDNNNFLTFNGNLCFWAIVGSSTRYQLWYTNGTPQGTYSLTNFNVDATIKSITEINNKIYFFATFTNPDAIYVSNLVENDATPLFTLSNNQRLSNLVSHGNKLYRIARYEIFEITNNTETLIYSDLNNCIGEHQVINDKLVFNKRACSTVDPLYQSTESFDFNTKTTSTISNTIPITNGKSLVSRIKVWNGNLYSHILNLHNKPITGPGSLTDVLFMHKINGSSINNYATLFVDSCDIEFNGYYESNNKLYFSVLFKPVVQPLVFKNIFRIYEVTASGIDLFFEFVDIDSKYKISKNNFAIIGNEVLFRADTFNSYSEKSNLLIGNGNNYRPLFYSTNSEIDIDIVQLANLNSNQALLSMTVNNDNDYIGRELYNFDINSSTTGLSESDNLQYFVFPNPSEDYIDLICNAKIDLIEIHNMHGQIVITSNQTKINIQNLESGIYFIQVQVNGRNYRTKLLKN